MPYKNIEDKRAQGRRWAAAKCLEAQFKDGMSWANRKLWHIDHIRPCAKFDLTDPAEQARCFNYTNLQPLWRIDNLRKGAL